MIGLSWLTQPLISIAEQAAMRTNGVTNLAFDPDLWCYQVQEISTDDDTKSVGLLQMY